MATKQFPNTLSCTGIPGGELYKIADDGTAALYCTAPPLGGKHPMAGNMNANLSGTQLTDATTLLASFSL
jgi:hypothetical protein